MLHISEFNSDELDTLQMRKERGLQRFMAHLDHANYEIHRAEQQTGLKFHPYLLGESEFQFTQLELIEEDFKTPLPASYSTCSYDLAVRNNYFRAVDIALENMRMALSARSKWLAECQRDFDTATNGSHMISLHLGAYRIYVMIPIEVAIAYELTFEPCGIIPLFHLEFDAACAQLYLSFNWSDLSVQEYERTMYYLGWKLQADRTKKNQISLDRFRRQCHVFTAWEQATFIPIERTSV